MQRKIIPDIVGAPFPESRGKLCQLPVESTAFEAANQMLECNVAAIAITDEEGMLEGIVTERDLTRRVLGRGLSPEKTKLGDIMTKNPDILHPEDSAVKALERMREHRYRHLPVVDDEGQVVAMLSIRNLHDAVNEALQAKLDETRAFVHQEE